MVVGLGQTPTHDLLDEDFSEQDGAFSTSELESCRLEVSDGTHLLTATSMDEVPLETFGFFVRRAYNVEIAASVVAVNTDQGIVGLECVSAASGRGAGGRYLFGVDAAQGRYVLLRLSGGSLVDATTLASTTGPALHAGQRLGLHCSGSSVAGSIDGGEVIYAADGTFGSFEALALALGPANPDDSVSFDDVVAEVPEHGEP